MDTYQVSFIKGRDVTTGGAVYPTSEKEAFAESARLTSEGYTTKVYIYRDGKGVLGNN